MPGRCSASASVGARSTTTWSDRRCGPGPTARYVLAEWIPCRVNIDYHIQVARHLYSVPYQLIHERVEARFTTTIVEIYFKGRRLTAHRRRYDCRPSTKPEHMPRAHRAHAEWTPSRLIRWAEQTGPATGHFVAELLRRRPHPEQGYRACLGLMRLGRRYGAARLEAASARATALGSYRYRTVTNILASAQDRLPLDAPDERPTTPAARQHPRGALLLPRHGGPHAESNRRSTSSMP